MRWVFWKLRLGVKLFWRYASRSWHLIEFCKVCGRCQPLLWSAPDDLWLRVTGKPEGVLCPECFDRRAAREDLLLRWTCSVDKEPRLGDVTEAIRELRAAGLDAWDEIDNPEAYLGRSES